ncbi:MAG: amino acid ABC transporter substrate-binding protein [Provencibacterium sp.]|jgi:ABC-type amino acid transport substrate-binding protein|nr:amino acid ABC transporter substrate-binding protein [Provencibacterium sp.]
MKKIFAAFLAAAMLASLGGCSSSSSTIDQIKKEGKLVMATNAAFPPFEYIEGNEPVGVDVDIAAEIAKDLGVTLEVSDMDFNAIIPAVQAGKASLGAAGMTVTDERKQQIDFSDEYVKSAQYVIVMKGSGVTVDSLSEAGIVIGVQEGTTGDFYATDEIKGDPNTEEVARYKNAIVASQDLMNGKCSAVIIDEMPAKSIVEANADTLELLPDVLTEESYAIAVKKGDAAFLEQVNKTIARLKSEGKIDEFLIKHTGE